MSDRGFRIRQAETSEIQEKCGNLVPEISLTHKYRARISDRPVTNFVAEMDSKVIAFVVGYGEESGYFYIYLFGVDPDHRNQGVGQGLLRHVERWAQKSEYNGMAVQSRNKFPDMLRLLIRNKYKIVAFFDRGHCDTSPVRFEKKWWS